MRFSYSGVFSCMHAMTLYFVLCILYSVHSVHCVESVDDNNLYIYTRITTPTSTACASRIQHATQLRPSRPITA